MSKIGAKDLLRTLVADLEVKYGHEAQSLALMLLEEILPLDRNDILLNKSLSWQETNQSQLAGHLEQLKNDTPIQHILGWSEFYGHRFKVNEEVLVPRQETEELVQLILELSMVHGYSSLLDIGTGSGCIGISIALAEQNIAVMAVDISSTALDLARNNAAALGADISLQQLDILKESPPGDYDIIVSNPPYVLESEKNGLPSNVLNKDPDLALFVSDDNPLLFYRRITSIATEHLRPRGLLIFEINENFGTEVAHLLKENGFAKVAIRQDINGRSRFVFGFKN